MRFGPVAPAEAEGAVLAHSMNLGGLRLRKGRPLSAADVAALAGAGVAEVTVARLDPGDVPEDAAAETVAKALAPDPAGLGLSRSAPFTGRVNLFADGAGVLRVDAATVTALNAVDPAITLATLDDWARVRPRQMVATVKVIPYAVGAGPLAAAVGAARAGAIALHPFRPGTASLILTRTPGLKESLIQKGAAAVQARLESLGWTLAPPAAVAHEPAAVAAALRAAAGDMILVLGGSATSDVADTIPAGLVAAGGRLGRLGMPVDPGNLLFLGDLGGRPVVGLPGSSRSPALSGVDWVLERLAAGLPVGAADLAAMGVGGLLKEIPARPQPRAGRPAAPGRPRVAAIVLAAGAGRRMRGRDKLLEDVGGRPVLRAVAEAAASSRVDEVVIVVPPDTPARRAALTGLDLTVVEASDWAEGMAASLRAGLAAASPRADAVVILLADMPEVVPHAIDKLIAAFDPKAGREIVRAVSADGTPGHPVLFGSRFFESLAALTGDAGAREVVRGAEEFVAEVRTDGRAALVDLDTPEEWAAWRAGAPR
jgi:molybdenum cofactor cytidylyltransferase